eukprot:TRINITY_DN3019_c0_g2_i1.p1 TRINITY_DN3019_c0_g2~~TRINITY_DN3019_c0_g2_i1.p1  ORF type:complete len:1775 (-),score=542.44 TRINITY_DN3019_c0_g2_i1:177-5501(-)
MSGPYPFRRSMTLTRDFHSAVPGSSGPIRVSLPRSHPDDSSTYRDDELDAFKGSIYRRGYASCPSPHCRLSFFSLAGIVAHKKNCSGFLRVGEFVTCPICEARFCQPKSLRTHTERNHGPPPTESQDEIKEDCLQILESKEDQNERLLRESRLISTPRPRGRPCKFTETPSEGFREMDYSYYLKHSSRYTVLDSEQPEETSPRVLKVRGEDGSLRIVRPEQQKEEDSWSLGSSGSSRSARSTRKVYRRESRRGVEQEAGPISSSSSALPPPPSSSTSLSYRSHVVPSSSSSTAASAERAPVSARTIHLDGGGGADDDELKTEEIDIEDNDEVSSEVSKKSSSLEEQRAILHAYEEIVLRSEALAENAKRKIKEKNDILKREKDLKSWEEELRQREAKAQRTINEALISLGSDSLDDCSKEDILPPPVPESTKPATPIIDLCDEISPADNSECYILPDSSTRSIRSNLSASSSSINEDTLSDSASIVTSLHKGGGGADSLSSQLSSPEPKDPSRPRRKPLGLVSKKKVGRISSNSRLGAKKRGRNKGLEAQLRQFLSSIDAVRPKGISSGDEAESIKILKPVRAPSTAELSNLKSTPSGVRVIFPSTRRLPLINSPDRLGEEDGERRRSPSNSSAPPVPEVNTSDLHPKLNHHINEDDSIVDTNSASDDIIHQSEDIMGEPSILTSSSLLIQSPEITPTILDIKDYFLPVKDFSKNEDEKDDIEEHIGHFETQMRDSTQTNNNIISNNNDDPHPEEEYVNNGDILEEEHVERHGSLGNKEGKRDHVVNNNIASSPQEPSRVNNTSDNNTPKRRGRKRKRAPSSQDIPSSTTPVSPVLRRSSRRHTPKVAIAAADEAEEELEEGPSTKVPRRSQKSTEPPLTPKRGRRKGRSINRETSPIHSSPSKNRRSSPRKLPASSPAKKAPSKKEKSSPKKKKSSPSPSKKKASISCGKCESSHSSRREFNVHTASKHGGLAREAGSSQTFSDDEIGEALKQAFRLVKKVVCFRCNSCEFTSRGGLLYHMQRCGKTKHELLAESVSCPHCPYRGLPSGLKLHLKTHTRPPVQTPKQDEEAGPPDVSESGRIRRSAAAKASQKMNESLSGEGEASSRRSSSNNDDGGGGEDKEFQVTHEVVDVKGKYKRRGKAYFCRLCKAKEDSSKAIIAHIISTHEDDDEEEYKNDDELLEEEEEDEENEENEPDDEPIIIPESLPVKVTPRRHYRCSYLGSLGKTAALYPCTEHLQSELDYRLENFTPPWETRLFSRIPTNEFIRSSEFEPYLPSTQESLPFSYRTSVEKRASTQGMTLKRFEGRLLGGVPSFFAGGPIWSIEWAPRDGRGEEFFAVSVHGSMDDVSPMFKLDAGGRGLIQIWSGGEEGETSPPVFKYGLLHDYGKIWCFKWCPSGVETERHLGLLASGCSNGDIYVHRIMHPSKENGLFYQHTPELILRPLRESFGQCLKLSWYNGRGHRVLGAAYSSGKVALYDMASESFLLRRGSLVHPYKVIQAHTSAVNGIDLHGRGAFPSYLATGSFDRHYSITDLSEPHVPLVNAKKGLISDLHFFRSFPDGFVSISHDDVYLQSHTQTILSEPGLTRPRTQPILCHNSAIKNESPSFWLGGLGVGTSAGELIVFVSPSSSTCLETDKFTTRRRTLVFRSEISLKDPSTNSIDYAECTKNLKELTYVNMNLEEFIRNPVSELDATRTAERLSLEDITNYPLAAVNRLSFNPNLRACSLLLSGSQNGIGRVHNLVALKHSSFPQFLETYINKFENRGGGGKEEE